MGQGRRWLATGAMLLCALLSTAGELPDAPSREQPAAFTPAPALRGAPPAVELAEWIGQPVAVQAPVARKKVFDKKFGVLSALAAGLTVADFELTQRCLQRRTCVEADPLMPSSRAGMYATNIPLNAALFWWSYRRKQEGKRLWWVAPLVVIGSHAAGVATNVPFIGK